MAVFVAHLLQTKDFKKRVSNKKNLRPKLLQDHEYVGRCMARLS